MRDPQPIRALVFDFDGLILDTETSVFEGWRVIYDEAGHELSLHWWQQAIGTDGADFDPLAELQRRVGEPLDLEALVLRRRSIRDADLARRTVLPGIEATLERARALGLKLAVASSSPLDWVGPHVERLGLMPFFHALATREDVTHAKPAPDLYLLAAERLGVAPERAIAFEDSPPGVHAAKAAGMYCVAVPGPMTRSLSFEHADATVTSLAEGSLDRWIAAAQLSDPSDSS